MGIGADLKKAREDLGISLQVISEKTKINTPFLEAIEREDWSVFPSHTFAKGFLRAYAKMVKVDTVLATRQFNEEVAPTRVTVAPSYNIEQGPIQAAPQGILPVKTQPSVAPREAAPASAAHVQPPAPVTPAAPPVAPASSAPVTSVAPQAVSAVKATGKPSAKREAKASGRKERKAAAVPVTPPVSDLQREMEEKAAAEERLAVARMIFTRPDAAPEESGAGFRRVFYVLGALVALAILVLVALGVYRWVTAPRGPAATSVEDMSALPAATPVGVPMTAPPTPPPAPRRYPKNPAPVRAAAQASAAPTSPAVPSGAAPTTVSQVPPVLAPNHTPIVPTQAQALAQAAAPVDRYHHLVLKGLESSWVQVTGDNGQKVEFNLLPGQVRAFQSVKGFAVKVGNAAGVDAQYDGRSLGVLGGRGSVVDFSLPLGYKPPGAQ